MGLVHYEEKPKEVIIPAENISTVLTGLENFALYRIEMTGFTIKGDGPSKVIFAGDLRWISFYKWLSKVIEWLWLLRFVIGLKISHQFVNRIQASQKQSHYVGAIISRALFKLQVIGRNSN